MEADYGMEHVGLLGVISKEEEEWEKWELEQREKWERGEGEVEEEWEWDEEGYDNDAVNDNDAVKNDDDAHKQRQHLDRREKNKKESKTTVDRPKPRSKKESRDSGVSDDERT